jgi:hypothetical protein
MQSKTQYIICFAAPALAKWCGSVPPPPPPGSARLFSVYLGGIPQQAPKGDNGGEAGEVEEEVGGQALQWQSILHRGQVFTVQYTVNPNCPVLALNIIWHKCA